MNFHPQIDRLISIYAVEPLHDVFTPNQYPQLSILMYHSISNTDESNINPYYRLCTSPIQFEEQLNFIKQNNYTILSLEQAVKGLFTDKLNGRNVVITFDDGYKDFYTNAFPVLQKHGFTATVFLPVEFITNHNVKLKNMPHLSWNDIVELSQHGISFGSHTYFHRQLSELLPFEVELELKNSKRAIEEYLGITINTFSYPFAFPEARPEFVTYLKKCMLDCGYLYGVTTKIGTAQKEQDPLFFHRIPINSSDDLQLFKTKLEGNYDWLYLIQHATKKAKEKLQLWK